MFLGLLIAAWIGEFEKVGVITLVVLGIMTVASLGVDFLSGSLGAKRLGASKLAIVGAVAGTVIGLFFGLPGLLLGPFIGAVIGEYSQKRELLNAGKVGLGTWLGLVCGTAAKLALAFAMVGIFIISYVL